MPDPIGPDISPPVSKPEVGQWASIEPTRLGRTRDWLVRCLAGNAAPAASVSPQEWADLIAAARRHRVTSLVLAQLRRGGWLDQVPLSLRHDLEEARSWNTRINLTLFAQLQRVLRALTARHLDVMVLKGAYLAERVYGDIGCRPMGDVDLLVHAADVEAAEDVLCQSGFVPISEDKNSLSKALTKHVVYVHSKTRVVLELHWRLTKKESASFSLDALWERAVPVRVAGAAAMSMCPEDLLVYLCVHFVNHDFNLELLHLVDLVLVIDAFPEMRWAVVKDVALQWRLDRGIGLVLRLARDMLGARVPADVIDSIAMERPGADVLEAAQDLILSYGSGDSGWQVSKNFLRLREEGLVRRLRTIAQHMFLPPLDMAYNYGLPPHSARVWLYYPYRVLEHCCRYARVAIERHRQPHQLGVTMDKKRRLSAWLNL